MKRSTDQQVYLAPSKLWEYDQLYPLLKDLFFSIYKYNSVSKDIFPMIVRNWAAADDGIDQEVLTNDTLYYIEKIIDTFETMVNQESKVDHCILLHWPTAGELRDHVQTLAFRIMYTKFTKNESKLVKDIPVRTNENKQVSLSLYACPGGTVIGASGVNPGGILDPHPVQIDSSLGFHIISALTMPEGYNPYAVSIPISDLVKAFPNMGLLYNQNCKEYFGSLQYFMATLLWYFLLCLDGTQYKNNKILFNWVFQGIMDFLNSDVPVVKKSGTLTETMDKYVQDYMDEYNHMNDIVKISLHDFTRMKIQTSVDHDGILPIEINTYVLDSFLRTGKIFTPSNYPVNDYYQRRNSYDSRYGDFDGHIFTPNSFESSRSIELSDELVSLLCDAILYNKIRAKLRG